MQYPQTYNPSRAPGPSFHYSSFYAVLRIIWMPDSVKTGSLISPIGSLNEASSKGFCIWFRPKNPRSPSFCAELQSLSVQASLPNSISPETILARCFLRICRASSLVRVMRSSLQEAGLLDSLCFTRRWEQRTLPAGGPSGFSH